MMLPAIPLGIFDLSVLYQLVAAVAAGLAGWAQRQADPVSELTLRLRHPLWWRVRHPVQAARRWLR